MLNANYCVCNGWINSEELILKRLVIMAIYNPNAQLDEYKKKLVKEIRPYAEYLYIVCNGGISESAYMYLGQIANQVVIRENIGFDVGAYKDVLSEVQLNDYDELLLMNDTFYGFFYSLDEFFAKVIEKEEIDFWGLTEHPKGENELGSFGAHVQSYFLLIKSTMLHSKDFKEFWDGLSYPLTYQEAIKNFEIKFTTYFTDKGFKSAVYCDLKSMGIECEYNINPCFQYPFELIRFLRCPILKVKPVSSITNFHNTKEILDYIKDNSDYEVGLIDEQLKQKLGEYIDGTFTIAELNKFYDKYKRIFIYGHGKIAQRVSAYFEYRGWNYAGFIVSQKPDDSEEVLAYKEVEFEKTDGIVMALGRKFLDEVYSMIKDDVADQQLFLPKY